MRKRKQFVQMDAPKPRMTVAEFWQWERRQMLAFPNYKPIPVVPGDRVVVTMLGDGSVHTILIVEDGGNAAESVTVESEVAG